MVHYEGVSGRPDVPELITQDFEEKFAYFWEQISIGLEHLIAPHDLGELRVKALEKEQKFFEHVYAEVNFTASSALGTVVCLFDVDGTLGEIKDEQAEELHTLLRPAATPLITSLAEKHPEYLRFGILSVRPQSSLDKEMEEPTYLVPVRPLMDDLLVYSSEMEQRGDLLWQDDYPRDYLEKFIESMRGIVRDDWLDKTLNGEVCVLDWYNPKIKMLANFIAYNPEATVILVDDLVQGDVIDPANSRLKVIHVNDYRQLIIPPPAANT